MGVTATSGLLSQISENRKREHALKGLPAITLKSEKTSKGFWIDLLTGNDNDMPVERLQNLIFTFIYVVIYVVFFFSYTKSGIDLVTKKNVFTLMNYINFETNAFVLMGISSGSYLIGKGMNR